MQSDLAVRLRPQPVSPAFQLALDRFITVELAVDDNACALVFAGDGLVARGQVDDAEAGVTESDFPVRGNPLPLAVGSAVVETLRRPLHHRRRNRAPARKHCNDST